MNVHDLRASVAFKFMNAFVLLTGLALFIESCASTTLCVAVGPSRPTVRYLSRSAHFFDPSLCLSLADPCINAV